MNTDWAIMLAKRFMKMFLIGGFSSALVTLADHPLTIGLNWRSWLLVMVTAFLSGGLAAAEKYTQGYNPQ